ncbi:ribose operon transcriptional repressor RbsR [Thorsellia anophelis]|uniref:Transcriptional regulator, LacI family n=1 Tax=Thorsellia anophelis DSM 18579 TaxID=1123402 RepID=A0A1I0AF28_9GAMM|nr:ribose operon transcriptional repressor RbsR [Thorsellia anophelis]SES92857.1 transcriptional regulator, LacI family [Thorsellia anophelis DSM 18579]
MATMKDVAKLAKVSTSTVSHVINQNRFVSDSVAKRVLQAIETLNYAPSALARSLKMKQTKTIGMLVTASSNPFYAEVVTGVEQSCYERGYSLVLCNTAENTQRFNHNLAMLMQKRVDGLIIMCTEGLQPPEDLLNRYPSIPIVMMDWSPFSSKHDVIQDNSLLGGTLACQHLIDMGHTRIACIAGPLDKATAKQRLAGFRLAMSEVKLDIIEGYEQFCKFEFEGGLFAMQTLLRLPIRPTAVFAGNDAIALGAYQAIFRAQLSIPNDISIIGYDDIALCEYLTPPLTTIHQPKDALGELAVDALLHRITHPDRKGQILSLTPELIERQSVYPLI